MRLGSGVTKSRAAVAALVVVVVIVAGVWLSSVGGGREPAMRTVAPLPTPTAPRLVPPTAPPTTALTIADPGGSKLRVGVAHAVGSPAKIADAIGPRVPLFSAIGDTEAGDVVDNPTFEGLPVTGLVMEQRGDWINIQISRRPNEATAWAHAADFHIRETPYKIHIDSTAHTLTLTDKGASVFATSVANGTGGTPTPTGTFFIDGIVKLIDPTGPYGTYQLSVAAFSDVLHSFGGGNGQIAIHGTNSPDLVGSSVSHGCVRMTNDDITKLASLVSVGVPVEITP